MYYFVQNCIPDPLKIWFQELPLEVTLTCFSVENILFNSVYESDNKESVGGRYEDISCISTQLYWLLFDNIKSNEQERQKKYI